MDKSFLKHASVYGLALLLVRAASFVLLPVYLRCLTPADYGVLDVVERMAETVGTCLMFGGFRQALLTFYSQASDDRERHQVVSTTLTLVLLAATLGGVLALYLSRGLIQLLGAMQGSEAPPVGDLLVLLAILGIVLEPFTLIPLTLVQARTESFTYVVVSLAQMLFRIALCIVLVKFLRWGVAGALTANVALGVIFGLTLCTRELLRGVSWPSWPQARRMLAFALPMLPSGLCFFLLNYGDRFFLLRYCPTEEIGTYGLGYKLAMIVTVFSLNPLYMVWSARMYAEARKPDAPAVFGRTFTHLLAAYLVAGLGMCLFAPEVVYLLGGTPYARASLVIAPVVLACFFKEAAGLMDAGFYVRHRMGAKLGITLAGTAVILWLYAWWIPLWGAQGAALATLGGFAFLAVATWWVSQRIFPVRYEWARLSALLGLAAGAWLLAEALPPGLWVVPAKGMLLAGTLLLPWAVGLIRPEEKQAVQEQLSRVAQRVGGLLPTREPRPVPAKDANAVALPS